MSVPIRVEQRLPVPAVPVASVLLVDDRPANLLALESILAPLGLRLVRASSGQEALMHLLKQPFALILLDVQMPGMDGFETASAIKAHSRTSDIPIIFITALNRDANHVYSGYAHGAVDYLLKPFDPDILRAKVSILVELYRKAEVIKEQARILRQQEAELAERRLERRYRRLTELMPMIVWATRPSGVVYYANEVWTEYSGLTAESTGSIANPAMLHPEDVDAVASAWTESLAVRRRFEAHCRLRRNADGAHRWHLVRAVPERDDDGVLQGWIVTATDIHEQKMIEESRELLLAREKAARETAESANRMKDEFLANVSHELRTPLNAILGWSRMLRSGMLEATRAGRALETIERSAQMQAEIIEDLLDVSRIISGKLRIAARRTDVVAVVQAATDTVRPTADAKGVELRWVCALTDFECVCDPGRLQQVVCNLLTNAVKFTPKGGVVEVHLVRGDKTIEVRVADSGSGISSAFLPYVFDRFRQADNSTARSHHGLGLGLAIVRHLVELHGGQVRAESAGIGQGSTFTVILPHGVPQGTDAEPDLFHARGDSREPAKGETFGRRLDGLTVLFVDDQEEARDLVRELLEHSGATVITVDSARAVMETLKATIPDVFVSDIGLPEMDGYGLIRSVRALSASARVPAIALSGYARSEDSRRALAAGFQVHLSKPVDSGELVGLIASLAEARSDEP